MRIVLALVDTASLVTTVITGFLAILILEQHGEDTGTDISEWSLESPGWVLHITSTASEWIMAISFDIFILTMWVDFSDLSLTIDCHDKQAL